MRSILRWSYRRFQEKAVKRWVLPWFFSKPRQSLPDPGPAPNGEVRIWLHAASVGELESIFLLATTLAKNNFKLIITVFSESATRSIQQLKEALAPYDRALLYCGFSPWEGEWSEALRKFQPTLFITVKYEAWPDLWMSLRENKIPLAVVSARARNSLKMAHWSCNLLMGGIPELILFPCSASHIPALKKTFPEAQILVAGEPRWDRVYFRSQIGNLRAKELIQIFGDFRRPWGVIGSAWLEDLRFLKPLLRKKSGSLWIVPHRIDEVSVQAIETFLGECGLKPIRTSTSTSTLRSQAEKASCVLVDEIGCLSELYSVADWSFVGGGFGSGVHSTIEPAIYGIPIGIGPRGSEKFHEIQELSESGQVSILRDSHDLLRWLAYLEGDFTQKKKEWIGDAQHRLGATQKISDSITQRVGVSLPL